MKKYFLSLVAIAAAMLFATSCQESLVEPQLASPTTFTVQLPDQMGTKAFGEAGIVTELLVEVYPQNRESVIYQTVAAGNGQFEVALNLIQDQAYDILFWAQTADGYVDVTETDGKYSFGSLRNVPMNSKYLNNDNGAAFFHAEKGFVPNGTSTTITLVRPFAQLNLGTTPASLITDAGEYELVSSAITVTGMANSFNVFSGEGFGDAVATYSFTTQEVPAESEVLSAANATYKYVSMNYLSVLGNEKALVDIDATIVVKKGTEEQTIKHSFTSVPVQENYRTNIVGNLISSTTDFNVVVDADFAEDANGNPLPDNDYFVVDNVAEAHKALQAGETYIAINSIRNGESVLDLDYTSNTTLYIQLPDTDATLTVQGAKVEELYLSVPDTNPNNDGLTLSINTPNAHVVLSGQVYDAPFISTSSSTLVLDGVKIKKSVTVEQGNVVVGEGTVIGGNDEGSQIISDEAIVIINGTENDIIVEGDKVVVVEGTQDEINVSNVSELRAAVNTIDAGGVINITNDITDVNEAILINKNITINGDDNSISGTASRIFRICSSDLKVEMNDLNIVSKAVRIGDNDIRGISIDPKPVEQVSLTLNNCTVDFTHQSACDWSYAVNIAGSRTDETKHKITISGGSYKGANVININGVRHNITVTNAELTSLYPYSDAYYGSCIYLVQGGNSDLLVEGNTFKGDHAVAINTRTGNNVSEKDNIDNTKRVKVKVENNYFYTLAEAVESIESKGVIKLLFSFESDPVTIPNGKTITLNLNGKTVTAVDNSTGSYGLITNKANLTIVGPGTISLYATNDRDWNAYSSVISNNPGGNLTVGEGVVIEHRGGTDMAYGLDNLTNGKGTSAITTINGATVKSTYRAVRQFLNGVEATNELYVNAGATILNTTGTNKGIWMQDPSKNANTGKLVVAEGANVDDVYLSVTAGSTEWPVEVSIASSSLNQGKTVMSSNVPEGYEVAEVGGVWKVIEYVSVSTAEDLVKALKDGKNVVFENDITIAATSGGYNKAGILQNKAQTINGAGHTLTVTGAGATWDCAIYTNGGTIKNLTVAGAMRGIFTAGQSSDLYIDNVVFKNVIYTFNSDGKMPANPFGVYVSKSTINGWTSHSDMHTEVVYTNCSFGEGSGYAYCRPYGKTAFVECTFSAGYTIDQTQTNQITFTDCNWDE